MHRDRPLEALEILLHEQGLDNTGDSLWHYSSKPAGSRGLGAVACALRYEAIEPPEAPYPAARVAYFARSHYYLALSQRLGRVADGLLALGSGRWPRKGFQVLCNSRLPERPSAAGLGPVGRQGLVMPPGMGPGCVIGILCLPFPTPESLPPPVEPGSDCASCRACLDACPTGALGDRGRLDPDLCLQAWASREGAFPPRIAAAWGRRLYGCDACLDACPRLRRDPLDGLDGIPGRLGAYLPADEIAAGSDAELAARFSGSAMGFGWLGAASIRRNALAALARGLPSV